ncbi:MAG: helix-turn-helix domain-containing protein [Putridiphycobacter sp.]|jgi:transcriptional regulator with XRE-family HTH domain
MSFGTRLSELRKKRGFSQEELANMIGTKGPAIGRYEREIAKPTIEVATKLSKILEVSLDYLVGNSDTELDKDLVDKIVSIQNLPPEEQNKIYSVVDALIRDYKAKQAYS